jgi:radical SAM superfamily enzyme YgiQ (UPF0313 family)
MVNQVQKEMIRYSQIHEKNKREIVLLRGKGCTWRKCRFCDYHLDFSLNETDNFKQNQIYLKQVTGLYGKLEVINSGSFVDLDDNTMDLILEVCREKKIKQVHFECHWLHRSESTVIRERFRQNGIQTKLKIGVETFDTLFRESYLEKGITTDDPQEISKYFDEVCLLHGLPGQTKESMELDLEIGLKYFERVCVNIMQENSKPIKPDPQVIEVFTTKIYPFYKNNPRLDILLNNTEFGVGADSNPV